MDVGYNEKVGNNAYSTSLKTSFCADVSEVGNLILTPTTKSPRSVGFLDFGIPSPGYRSSKVGPVGPALLTCNCLPSIVCTVRLQPVRASLRSMSMVCLMSSPLRVNKGCGFCVVVRTILASNFLGNETYLLNDEVEILRATFHLITNIRELNFASCLQPLLNGHLENAILGALLASRLIIRLPLDLHLLCCSIIKLLQRNRKRLLYNCNFGRMSSPTGIEPSCSRT